MNLQYEYFAEFGQGGGSKNPKNVRTSYKYRPNTKSTQFTDKISKFRPILSADLKRSPTKGLATRAGHHRDRELLQARDRRPLPLHNALQRARPRHGRVRPQRLQQPRLRGGRGEQQGVILLI